ncbi:MAG: 23S rRNA (uracil-C(5))-methyltransferase RlmCD [Nitrospinaceae bacterium]|nr:MAG: 23S rRNA (uracil-C(5))-methyltransferase RlmCD [Nitrospinaceae bacterium]
MAKLQHIIPVKVGDQLELTVETQGSSGDGICRHEGYTLFVPEGLPGDTVMGEVSKVTPRFGVARVLDRLKASEFRVEAPCPVFLECGGCKLQDLLYEKQMEFKVRVVSEALQHIGKITPPDPIKTLPAERPYHYRNKGSFAVALKDKKLEVGFYQQGTHEVADSDRCDILLPPINEVKEHIRGLLIKHRVLIYSEKWHKGFLRGIVVRHSEATGETLIGFITTKGRFPKPFLKELTDAEFLERYRVAGIVQNLNDKDTNVILGGSTRKLWGKGRFADELDGLQFRLALGSFMQVHSPQAVRLYEVINQWVTPGKGKVLDAYCGSGGISLWLARAGRSVIGIEEFPEAIEDAKESAKLNGIETCEFLQGTVETHLPKIVEEQTIDTVIVDPPRKGCSKEVVESILKIAPETIVYVSCNPATLARDLARMEPYRIEDMVVIDMFPQTQHVETAVLLRKS